MFVHFQPVDHESMNDRDREEKRHPTAGTAAAAVPKKVDSMGSALKKLFGSSDSSAKKAAAPVNKKAHIGGHEQTNHDEDHVQQHLDVIDKENEALAAAVQAANAAHAVSQAAANVAANAAANAALKAPNAPNAQPASAASAAHLDPRSRMSQEKSEAQLDDKTAAIKATLLAASAQAAADQQKQDFHDPDSADQVGQGPVHRALPAKRPVMKARKSGSVKSPEHVRFNRRFAAVDSKSRESGDAADGTDTADPAAGSQEEEEPGTEESEQQDGSEDGSSEEGMAEAANAIADMVDPGNQELVDRLRDAAANGDHEALTKLLDDQNVHLIHTKDENDWNLLHEAIRSGDLDSVKLLVDLGADIGAKVLSGGAALWIAKYYLEEDHPVTKYLRDIGAPEEEEL